jgi:tetratricopeptide (TPR) repeat protein
MGGRTIHVAATLAVATSPPLEAPSPIAIAIAAVAAVAWFAVQSRRSTGADPIARMVSAAPLSTRTIKPRLSGGYGWAPFRNVMAEVPDTSAEELKASSVAGQVLQQLKNDTSARALHAKGIAYLVRDNAAAAVPLLRQAARLLPKDARIWNDLAAALYVFAQSDVELREALAAAKIATRLDPGLTEGYFNIALILERGVGTREQIKNAWREYLRHDPSGGWSDEAKERLALYE